MSVLQKWLFLKQQFEESKESSDAEIFAKVKELLMHDDLSYVQQGLSLLLNTGLEQLYPYLYLREGVFHWNVALTKPHFAEQALFASIPDFPMLEAFYDLGAFDEMEHAFLEQAQCADVQPYQKEKILPWLSEMLHIPAGRFVMGALEVPERDTAAFDRERPSHEVILTQDFLVGKYPVTQILWESVMGRNPSWNPGSIRPVNFVSWLESILFCNRLSRQFGLIPVYDGFQESDINEAAYYKMTEEEVEALNDSIQMNPSANGYRLLTEAEWEYAARGGEYHLYAGSDDIDEVAWHEGNSGGQSHAVGLKNPNGFGLYDMTGNVFEWCWNRFEFRDYEKEASSMAQNPTGSSTGFTRINRGGSFRSIPRMTRVSNRSYFDPNFHYDHSGLRLARNVDNNTQYSR